VLNSHNDSRVRLRLRLRLPTRELMRRPPLVAAGRRAAAGELDGRGSAAAERLLRLMAGGVLVRGRGGGAAGGGATCAMASRIPVMREGRVRVPAATSFRLSVAMHFFRFDVLGRLPILRFCRLSHLLALATSQSPRAAVVCSARPHKHQAPQTTVRRPR